MDFGAFPPPAPAKPIALATSADRPVQDFPDIEHLADAILGRPGSHANHVVKIGVCTARCAAGEAALAVYGVGERVGFLGYALGLGHDRVALEAALRAAATPFPFISRAEGAPRLETV